MVQHPTFRIVWLLLALSGVVLAPAAQAALQSRAGGQAWYDDVADLTWAATASQSTGGSATTGLDWYVQHVAWIESLTIDGVDGWRLPMGDVSGEGLIAEPCGELVACRENEMAFLYAQNGISTSNPGFFSFTGTQYISSTSVNGGTVHNAFDFSTGANAVRNIATNQTFALAVRTGDVFGPPGAEGPNLIANGSFEVGASIPPGSFLSGLTLGNTSITSWTIADGNLDYIGTLWQASDGTRSLDMTGDGYPGSIGQTLSTQMGHRYRVRFDLAGNPTTTDIKTIRVVAGDEVRDFAFDNTGRSAQDMGWRKHSFEFDATSTSTTLYFVSLVPGSHGPTLDNVEVRDIGPPTATTISSAELEIVNAYQFELLYNDSGSGGSKDGAFHRPVLPPGYFAVAHQGQGHYGSPGQNGKSGKSVVVVRERIPGSTSPPALAPPSSFTPIWNDSNSGATRNGSAWRPVPPVGYQCLGDFFTNDWTSPDVSTNPMTLKSLDQFRCVRADLTVPGAIGSKIWDDEGTGASSDFSAHGIGAADAQGLAVGGFVGNASHDPPTLAVHVLRTSATTPPPSTTPTDGPYLEVRMLRDMGTTGPCDWDSAIYNDTGTDADDDVAWWHPQNIPAGFHQLGHTYERFHNPSCSLDPLLVAREIVPGALAPPIGWDYIPQTIYVDQIWDDRGSEGALNGGLWRPIPAPGYRCLGTFATGGFGYAPPDAWQYTTYIHPINQQVAAAAENFRCVREDLLVAARVKEWGWDDSGSGASLNTTLWEIDPAETSGEGSGVDVGHFVATRGAMPTELLYTISEDVMQDVPDLTQTEFDALVAQAPILQLHPSEHYWPDDPIYTLDHHTSLCSGEIPNEGDFYHLDSGEAWGEITTMVVPSGLSGPNFFSPYAGVGGSAGDGSFFATTPQCISAANVNADNLMGHVYSASSTPAAGAPDFKFWLEIDSGPVNVFGEPLNDTGDTDQSRTRVVVRVLPWNSVGHEVQYWIWYPYNGPGKFEAGCGSLDLFYFTSTTGRHQGDWEVVSVRYDDQGRAAEMYLSQHGNADVFSVKPTPAGLSGPITSGGASNLQPIVASAIDSHANYRGFGGVTYAEPKSTNVGACTAYLRLEDLTGPGPQIDLSDPTRLIVASSEFDDIALESPLPLWLDFPGRWGGYEALEVLITVDIFGNQVFDEGFDEVGAGPSGPPFKSLWEGRAVPEPTGALWIGLGGVALLASRRARVARRD